jgi:protein required for attachment to host cells
MSHTTTWILVANASLAFLYESRGRAAGIKLIRTFEHPSSRAKGADLISDRPGHATTSGRGDRRTAMEPNTNPRRHEQERFAHELARELDVAHAKRRYDKLVLTASAAFLGMVKSQLPKDVERSIIHSQNKDYTATPPAELATQLRDHLPV